MTEPREGCGPCLAGRRRRTPVSGLDPGPSSWFSVVLLGATGFVAYLGWTLGSGADVPISGYVSMALGVVLSLAVGFGLMGLVFYSSRRGYDEAPVYITTEDGSGPEVCPSP